jgi:hypothetical protein
MARDDGAEEYAREHECGACMQPWEVRFEWDYTSREQYCLEHLLEPIEGQPGKTLLDYMPDCQRLTHRVLDPRDGSVQHEVKHTSLPTLYTLLTGRIMAF